MTKTDVVERFIEFWGSMGVLWGINRSMARIHALILVSEEKVGLEDVTKKLNISRGNASMSLNELRQWGVIRQVHKSGDRRDFYVAEQDVWKMLFHIAVERKKREFDPALFALQELLREGEVDKLPQVAERLHELEKLMSTAERLSKKFLADDKKSRSLLSFVSHFLAE